MLSPHRMLAVKVLVFALCLLPLGFLAWGIFNDSLGANPIEAVIRDLGDWALRFLLITLAVTPLRRFTGVDWLLRLRRMLGLYAFFYALLHLAGYLWLDQFFDWAAIGKDIIKRPFITVGFAALVLLIPLAITSTKGMMRRLGRRWKTLHRSIYLIAAFAVLHYWWMVKLDTTQPALYTVILAILLAARLPAPDKGKTMPQTAKPAQT